MISGTPGPFKVAFASGGELEVQRHEGELRVRFKPENGEATETVFKGDKLAFNEGPAISALYLPLQERLVVVDQRTNEAKSIPFGAIDDPALAHAGITTATGLQALLREIVRTTEWKYEGGTGKQLAGLTVVQLALWRSPIVVAGLPVRLPAKLLVDKSFMTIDMGTHGSAKVTPEAAPDGSVRLRLGLLNRDPLEVKLDAVGILRATRVAEQKAAEMGVPLIIADDFKV